MPTARELLEQADALMRRDRDALAAGERARPSSTPITMTPRPLVGGTTSPRTIQREPIAPSIARTSLPVHPTDSPALAAVDAARNAMPKPPSSPAAPEAPLSAAPGFRDEPAVAATSPSEVGEAADADFPTLTDAVIDMIEVEEGGTDVPLLTDAIEPTSVEVGVLDLGEPSIWDVTSRAGSSVLGREPDSVAVVPMLDGLPVAPVPSAAGDEEPAQWRGTGWPGVPASAPTASEHDVSVPQPAPAAETEGSRLDAAIAQAAAASGEGAAMGAMRPDRSEGTLSGFVPLGPQPDVDGATGLEWDAAAAPRIPEPEPSARVPASGWQSAPASAGEPAAAGPALDDARIAEAVDEIRMQVLQRIDIFTDTTLRAKLGEQLQPLVERASADLVATINQHVGDLLRTYVAEALEQEIERWRSGQHQ